MGCIAIMGIPPGDVVMALAFTATVVVAVASTFGGGGVGVRNAVAMLGEDWV